MSCVRSILLLATLTLTGCNVQTGISPTETIITKCSGRDFGFVGTWVPHPSPQAKEDVETYEMIIRQDDAYTATMKDTAGNGEDISVDFRTHEISTDQPHAIVEIEHKQDGKVDYHRLAIAAVKDDQLHLWMIDGRKIGEHLYKDGTAAVIEHFTFYTIVRCNSEKLLESITKHSGNIAGDVQVFKRKEARQ